MGHRGTTPSDLIAPDNWEQKCSSLAAELTAGRDVAKQLQLILSFIPPSPPSSSHHYHSSSSSSSEQAATTREVLVQKILTSYENALSMLNSQQRYSTSTSALTRMMPAQHHHHHHHPNPGHDDGIGMVVRTMKSSESSPPGTRSGSPGTGSEDSDSSPHDHFKDTTSSSSPSRKRKSIPRWTHQVRVSLGMGLEGPLDDGFSWRKYGQKDILGAKYPRGYYRCTLRNVQGCLATKQVQRSDDDSTVFEITYRGRHTCNQSPSPANHNMTSLAPPPPPEPAAMPGGGAVEEHHHELLLNFQRGLNVVVTESSSEFQHSSPPTTVAADHSTTFGGSLFFPPPPPPAARPPPETNAAMATFAAPTSSMSSSVYHHHSFGSDGNNNDDGNYSDVIISYGREQSIAGVAGPATTTVGLVDFPFGNMDHLFGDPTTTSTAFTFDNSGFFS